MQNLASGLPVLRGPADAVVRSRQLARTLPDPARVILLAADGAAAPASSPERIEGSRTDLGRACARVLATHGVHAQVGGRGAGRARPPARRGAAARP